MIPGAVQFTDICESYGRTQAYYDPVLRRRITNGHRRIGDETLQRVRENHTRSIGASPVQSHTCLPLRFESADRPVNLLAVALFGTGVLAGTYFDFFQSAYLGVGRALSAFW